MKPEMNGEISSRDGVPYGMEFLTIGRRQLEVSIVITNDTHSPLPLSAVLYEICQLNSVLGFLVHFESELLKRSHKNFSFQNGR